MSFELFVASRYLVSRRKQTFISIISLVSVLGVAIGVAALVVVMAVYNGFTNDIREKILGSNSHILLMSADATSFDPIPNTAGNAPGAVTPLLARIKAMPGVKAVTPFLYTEVLLSTPRGATGLVLRGIDPGQAVEALPMLAHLEEGSIEGLSPPAAPAASGAVPGAASGDVSLTDVAEESAFSPSNVPGILIGKDLAQRFSLTVGSRINLLSPSGQRTAAGFAPKLMAFRVAGVFKAGMSDFDSRLAYISLEAGQNLIGLPAGRISGLDIYLDDPYAARDVSKKLEQELGLPFYTRNWMDNNAGLFAALQLERIGMFIVLAMVILVASFSIITSLVMLVMEKTRDIAILMSMGATGGMVRRIFTLQGVIIGVVGTSLGYVLGLSLAWVLKRYHFIELPPGVYPMDYLPIMINPLDTVLIGAVSLLMCFLATIYPARQAARLVPAEALRYE